MANTVKNKISIIMPVYNVEEYLEKSLDSVVGQTYKDLEIICIDDGSQDGTLSILEKYAEKDERIVLLKQENQGVAVARNRAIDIATGEFMMFVDGDDWLETDACETLISIMEKEEKPDVIMYSYYREYADRSLLKENIFPEDYIVFDEEGCRNLYRRHAGIIGDELAHPENADAICSLCTKMFKTAIIQDNGIKYIDNKIVGTNGDGVLNLFYYEFVHKAVFVNKHLYHYRKTNMSSIVTAYKKNFPERWNNMFNIIGDYIKEKNLPATFSEGLDNRIAFSIVGLGLNELANDTGFGKKYKEIKKILHAERFKKAVKQLDTHLMPIHWKAFYTCAKLGLTPFVYLLLVCITKLKKKV